MLEIAGYQVLLPLPDTMHPNIEALRVIPSADGRSLTLFLADRTFEQELFLAGRLAVCDKLPDADLYVIAQSGGTPMGWKDRLVVATAVLILGGFLFAIFKALEGRAFAGSQPAAWMPSDTPARVMWRWGLGIGFLAVAPAYYVFNAFLGTSWYYSATVGWILWAFFILMPVVASFTAGVRTGKFRYGWGTGCIAGIVAGVSLATAELISYKVTGFGAGIGTDTLADNLIWAAECIAATAIAGAILSAIGSGMARLVRSLFAAVTLAADTTR